MGMSESASERDARYKKYRARASMGIGFCAGVGLGFLLGGPVGAVLGGIGGLGFAMITGGFIYNLSASLVKSVLQSIGNFLSSINPFRKKTRVSPQEDPRIAVPAQDLTHGNTSGPQDSVFFGRRCRNDSGSTPSSSERGLSDQNHFCESQSRKKYKIN